MCACLPTVRIALVRGFRIFRETTVDYGYAGKKSYRNSSFRNSAYRRQWSSSTRPGASRTAPGETVNGEPRPPTPNAVLYQKSFAVEYNNHEDDTALVPMREFVISGGSSMKSGESSSA